MLDDSGRPRKRAKQEKTADDDVNLGCDDKEAATDREEAELVEDLFTLDSGWSVEVLGEDDSKLYDLEVDSVLSSFHFAFVLRLPDLSVRRFRLCLAIWSPEGLHPT